MLILARGSCTGQTFYLYGPEIVIMIVLDRDHAHTEQR